MNCSQQKYLQPKSNVSNVGIFHMMSDVCAAAPPAISGQPWIELWANYDPLRIRLDVLWIRISPTILWPRGGMFRPSILRILGRVWILRVISIHSEKTHSKINMVHLNIHLQVGPLKNLKNRIVSQFSQCSGEKSMEKSRVGGATKNVFTHFANLGFLHWEIAQTITGPFFFYNSSEAHLV